MTPKEFQKLGFNEMVDVIAGEALLKLVKGENWRSIIWMVAQSVAQWQAVQKGSKP